jgi:hypothetical protein
LTEKNSSGIENANFYFIFLCLFLPLSSGRWIRTVFLVVCDPSVNEL